MENRRKVAFIDTYYKGLYGAPKSMLTLAKELVNRNYDVDVITSKEGPLSNRSRNQNINTRVIPTDERLLSSQRDLSLLQKIKFLILIPLCWISSFRCSLDKYDVICVNDIKVFLLYFPLMVRYNKKVVWYIRINARVPMITFLGSLISRKVILISSDCFDCFNKFEKSFLRKKIEIIHTGFPIEENISSNESLKKHAECDKVFINVGSLCPRKNQLAIIRSFSKITFLNKHLYLIGSPPDKADESYLLKIKELINNLDLEGRVSLIAHTDNVSSYLSFSDIFLFASLKEGLPRVVLEALLDGCLVVTSKVDGVSDILVNDNLGLITDRKASDIGFENEFVELINKSIRMQSDSHYMRNFVMSEFSLDKYVGNFIEKVLK
ncbi:glycosyltransferase [Vibrio lentus]|uniref:glycosyltransferase n=1 Tax=Vibrio lentus TaxID=136468 RepID=UPI000CC1CBD7|nr:glycosyltransferase [Vibrio lentus]PMH92271.1 hypothetical protein BCU56_09740 [Vibrio lentus]